MPEFAERFPPPAALFERVDPRVKPEGRLSPASGRGKKDRAKFCDGPRRCYRRSRPPTLNEALMTIELHTWNTPNGRKISVALEEMGLPYKVFPLNIAKGQHIPPP